MRPALFLDRDGVINVDKHHAYRIEDMDFIEGIFDLARFAHAAGLPLIIITNQAGIARGKFTEQDFSVLMAWMGARFAAEGAPLTAVYHCPTHAEFPEPVRDAAFAGWRKPEPGMLLAAARDHAIDLENSYLVGDRWSDARAGIAAGLRRVLIIGTTEAGPAPVIPRMDRGTDVAGALDWLRGQLADRRVS